MVPELIEALRNEDEDIRAAAAETLAIKGNVAAVPALIRALQDDEESVRKSAVSALGTIGDAAIVPRLIEALNDSDSYVRQNAVYALEELATREAKAALKAYRKNQERANKKTGGIR